MKSKKSNHDPDNTTLVEYALYGEGYAMEQVFQAVYESNSKMTTEYTELYFHYAPKRIELLCNLSPYNNIQYNALRDTLSSGDLTGDPYFSILAQYDEEHGNIISEMTAVYNECKNLSEKELSEIIADFFGDNSPNLISTTKKAPWLLNHQRSRGFFCGWDSWTRTNGMQESKSCALPTWLYPIALARVVLYHIPGDLSRLPEAKKRK